MSENSDPKKQADANVDSPVVLSALVELVGIQGIAEEDGDTFTKKTNEFRVRFESLSRQQRYKGKIDSKMWLDRCYIWSDKATTLLLFLREFRSNLMHGSFPAFSRSVVLEGCPVQNGKKGFSEIAAVLAESLLSFKAVGVRIDLAVRDRYLSELAESTGEANNSDILEGDSKDIPTDRLLFQNCYIAGEGAKQRLSTFWDLAWKQPYTPNEIDFQLCFKEMGDTILRSQKSSRYFAPLLANIARNVMPNELTPEIPSNKVRPLATTFRIGRHNAPAPSNSDTLSAFFFHLSSDSMLKKIKTMPGGSLALLIIVDRFHSLDQKANGMAIQKENHPTETLSDCKRYASTFRDHIEGWVYTFPCVTQWLDHDQTLGLAPAYILSGKSRGMFRKEQAAEMARYEQEKAKAMAKKAPKSPAGDKPIAKKAAKSSGRKPKKKV